MAEVGKEEENLAHAVVLIWWLPSLTGSDVGTVRRFSAGIHSETKKNAVVEAPPHKHSVSLRTASRTK